MNHILKFFLFIGLIGMFCLSENISKDLQYMTGNGYSGSDIHPVENDMMFFNNIDYSNVAILPQTVSYIAPVVTKIPFGINLLFIASIVSKIIQHKICCFFENSLQTLPSISELFINFCNIRT